MFFQFISSFFCSLLYITDDHRLLLQVVLRNLFFVMFERKDRKSSRHLILLCFTLLLILNVYFGRFGLSEIIWLCSLPLIILLLIFHFIDSIFDVVGRFTFKPDQENSDIGRFCSLCSLNPDDGLFDIDIRNRAKKLAKGKTERLLCENCYLRTIHKDAQGIIHLGYIDVGSNLDKVTIFKKVSIDDLPGAKVCRVFGKIIRIN